MKAWMLVAALVIGVTAGWFWDIVFPRRAEVVTVQPKELSMGVVIIDHETGCEYITYNGITPRLGVDGKILCRRTQHAQ